MTMATKQALDAAKLREEERKNREEEQFRRDKWKGEREEKQRDRNANAFSSILSAGAKIAPKMSFNDVEWYSKDAKERERIGSLTWGVPFGSNSIDEFGGRILAIPGVVVLHTQPSVGVGSGLNSALNLASHKLYTMTRKANAGAANYQPADEMEYCLALGDIYSYIGEASRIVGVLNTFEKENWYYPDGILQTLGIPKDNVNLWRKERLSFISELNLFIKQVNEAFSAPKDIAYFKRKFFMYANLFKDGYTERHQTYLMKPTSYFQWSEERGMASLYYVDDTQYSTPTSYMQIGYQLLQSLLNSTAIGDISGDIAKAFAGNLHSVPYVSEQDVRHPVFDELVLNQIHNATVVPEGAVILFGNVTQDVFANVSAYTPAIGYAIEGDMTTAIADEYLSLFIEGYVVSTTKESPNCDDAIESSRFMFTLDNARTQTINDKQYRFAYIKTCGTEIVVDCTICEISENGTINNYSIPGAIIPNWEQALTPLVLTYLINCEFAPCVAFQYAPGLWSQMWNVQNYAKLNSSVLETMNKTIMMNMFAPNKEV
jgi:hypothetical protein